MKFLFLLFCVGAMIKSDDLFWNELLESFTTKHIFLHFTHSFTCLGSWILHH